MIKWKRNNGNGKTGSFFSSSSSINSNKSPGYASEALKMAQLEVEDALGTIVKYGVVRQS